MKKLWHRIMFSWLTKLSRHMGQVIQDHPRTEFVDVYDSHDPDSFTYNNGPWSYTWNCLYTTSWLSFDLGIPRFEVTVIHAYDELFVWLDTTKNRRLVIKTYDPEVWDR